MTFRTREVPVLPDELTAPVDPRLADTETAETGIEKPAVEEAMRLIQKHIDKEARNRWVEHLEVRDLCPRQKADLVADLAHLF
jgi:hypothetical protein